MSKFYFYTSDLDERKDINLENTIISNLMHYFWEDYCFNKTPNANFVLGIRNLPEVNNNNITLYTNYNSNYNIPIKDLFKVEKFLFSNKKEYILLQGYVNTDWEELPPLINTDLLDTVIKNNIKQEKTILIFYGEAIREILRDILLLNIQKKFKIKIIGLEKEILIPEVEVIKINKFKRLYEQKFEFLSYIYQSDIVIFTNKNYKYNLTAVESLYMNKTVITLENNFFYEDYKEYIGDKIFILNNLNSIDKFLKNTNNNDIRQEIKNKNNYIKWLWSGLLDVLSNEDCGGNYNNLS